MAVTLPGEITKETRVPLSIVIAMVAIVAGGAIAWGGTNAIVASKPDDARVRAIAEDVAKHKADKSDVAALTATMAAIKEAVEKVDGKLDKAIQGHR
jgi:hypothetical protein